jgi:hypothetical protein
MQLISATMVLKQLASTLCVYSILFPKKALYFLSPCNRCLLSCICRFQLITDLSKGHAEHPLGDQIPRSLGR